MAFADAVIAANRFGFGAYPGELERLSAHAREALQEDIGRAGAEPATLISSGELLTRLGERTGTRRAAAGQGQEPAAGVAMKPREIHLPAYLADVQERVRLALLPQAGFHERIVHFWSNHFAVSVDKPAVLGLAGCMEREAIRPHVNGRFADLLTAVEQHPAMLLYLDNVRSMGPASRAALRAAQRGREPGLNENLGREILELHTLGVGGGYGQDDVIALAKIISGWSVAGIGAAADEEPAGFRFRELLHEPGAQRLLGRRYAEDGLAQGEAALRNLARHASTARHLATKLARHFIADDPPPAAVDALARAWLDSEGHLPTVYRALLARPEAWRETRTKFKTPSEYLISSYRLLEFPAPDGAALARMLDRLGQRPFQPASPAGWPDRSADWDGPAALLKRVEWAGQLVRGARDRQAPLLAAAGWDAAPDSASVLAIARAQDAVQGLTLLLAAPEFMRR
ncbi:MAG: DUF1800 domain-containing protein [Steroidobacteraceae bacterium]